MATGRYRLVRQVDGRGMFAIVAVEAHPAERTTIDMARQLIDPAERDSGKARWFEPAARTGVLYALEKAGLYFSTNHVAVTITELTILPVDTSVTQVFYAAAMATWQAVGKEGDLPITRDGRNFIVPA